MSALHWTNLLGGVAKGAETRTYRDNRSCQITSTSHPPTKNGYMVDKKHLRSKTMFLRVDGITPDHHALSCVEKDGLCFSGQDILKAIFAAAARRR